VDRVAIVSNVTSEVDDDDDDDEEGTNIEGSEDDIVLPRWLLAPSAGASLEPCAKEISCIVERLVSDCIVDGSASS
jgi:hypothetical protein